MTENDNKFLELDNLEKLDDNEFSNRKVSNNNKKHVKFENEDEPETQEPSSKPPSSSKDSFSPQPVIKTQGRYSGKTTSIWHLFPFASTSDIIYLSLGTFGALVCAIVIPVYGIFFGQALDYVLEDPIKYGWYYAKLFLLLGFFMASGAYMELYFYSLASSQMTIKLRNYFMQTLLTRSVSWHDQHHTGSLLEQLAIGASSYQSGLSERMGQVIQQSLSVIICIFTSLYIGWKYTLVVLSSTPIIIGAAMAMGALEVKDEEPSESNPGSESEGSNHQASESAATIAQEAVTGITTVKFQGLESFMMNKFVAHLRRIMRAKLRLGWLQGATIGVFMFSNMFCWGLALFYGAYLLRNNEMAYPGIPYTAGKVVSILYSLSFALILAGNSSPHYVAFNNARRDVTPLFRVIFEDEDVYRDEHDHLGIVGASVADQLQREKEEREEMGDDDEVGDEEPIILCGSVDNYNSMPIYTNDRVVLVAFDSNNANLDVKPKSNSVSIDIPSSPLPSSTSSPLCLNIVPTGRIVFDNVSFCYPTKPDRVILDSLSIDLHPAQSVAIVGPSGSGKSSLIALLEKFYNPTTGRILIEGVVCDNTNSINNIDYDLDDAIPSTPSSPRPFSHHNSNSNSLHASLCACKSPSTCSFGAGKTCLFPLSVLDTASWRAAIGLIAQEAVIFHGSVWDNLTMGNKVAMQKVLWALKAAHCNNIIEKLPLGLDTVLSGNLLSGGQRQRLCGVARALCSNNHLALLLADECTAALDGSSERVVMRSILSLMRTKPRRSRKSKKAASKQIASSVAYEDTYFNDAASDGDAPKDGPNSLDFHRVDSKYDMRDDTNLDTYAEADDSRGDLGTRDDTYDGYTDDYHNNEYNNNDYNHDDYNNEYNHEYDGSHYNNEYTLDNEDGPYKSDEEYSYDDSNINPNHPVSLRFSALQPHTLSMEGKEGEKVYTIQDDLYGDVPDSSDVPNTLYAPSLNNTHTHEGNIPPDSHSIVSTTDTVKTMGRRRANSREHDFDHTLPNTESSTGNGRGEQGQDEEENSSAIVSSSHVSQPKVKNLLIVAHRLQTIRRCDRIIVLKAGHVVEDGSHSQLLRANGVYALMVKQQAGGFEVDNTATGTTNTGAIVGVDGGMLLSSEFIDTQSVHSGSLYNGSMRSYNNSLAHTSNSYGTTNTLSTLYTDSTLSGPPSLSNAGALNTEDEDDDDDDDDEEEDDEDLDIEDDASSSSGLNRDQIMRVIRLCWRERWLLLLGTIFTIIEGLMFPSYAYMMGVVINTYYRQDQDEMMRVATKYGIVFIVIGVICGCAIMLRYAIFRRAGEKLVLFIKSESFISMMYQDMGWFDDTKNNTGVLLNRLTQDAAHVNSIIYTRYGSFISIASNFIFSFALACYLNWKCTIIMSILTLLLFCTSLSLQYRASSGVSASIETLLGQVNSLSVETINAVRIVFSNNAQTYVLSRFNDLQIDLLPFNKTAAMVHGVGFSTSEGVLFFIYSCTFMYTAWLLNRGEIDLEVLLQLYLAIEMYIVLMEQLPHLVSDIDRALLAVNNTLNLIEDEAIIVKRKDGGHYGDGLMPGTYTTTVTTKTTITTTTVTVQMREPDDHLFTSSIKSDEDLEAGTVSGETETDPSDGDGQKPAHTVIALPPRISASKIVNPVVSFNDVYFSYPSRPKVPVLKGLSLTIQANHFVGLLGKSGCGKSSALSLLSRLYSIHPTDPQYSIPSNSGSITIDGIDIDSISTSQYKDVVGIVAQNSVLFSGTIADNIRCGKDTATMEQVVMAAKHAGVHDVIMRMDQKYHTQVGNAGGQLSGGEKQRISLARVFLRNSLKQLKVLILDEATSALDMHSQNIIQNAIDTHLKGRMTIISITHRFETIKNADMLVVLDEGRIVDTGTFDELSNKIGPFQQLMNIH